MIRRRNFLIALIALLAIPATGQQIVRTLYSETATIAINQSLSAAIDLKGRSLVGIIMPSAWTTAQLSFQVSLDGSTYVNLYNTQGDEFISEASTSRFIAMSQFEFLPVRYVKIRSGTSAVPVNQAAARSLVLATRDVDGK